MVTDPIADMLTRIRNANTALHDRVVMPTYIVAWAEEAAEPRPMLVIDLKYGDNRERAIYGLKRVSKPGRRVYAKKDRLPRVLGGLGTAIMSTSTGVCTAAEAQKRGVGGEVLCFVW